MKEKVTAQKLETGDKMQTVAGLSARIIANDANIGLKSDEHHAVVALIALENGDDFIEWYNTSDYDSVTGILSTKASPHSLDLNTHKNESDSIDDMIAELQARGWTADPYPLGGVPLTNGFDCNTQLAYVSYADKVLVSEFPSAYYMALFLERVLAYDKVEHVTAETKGAYRYFLIDSETYTHDEINGVKDVPYSASQVVCVKLTDYTRESFIRKVKSRVLDTDVKAGTRDEVK